MCASRVHALIYVVRSLLCSNRPMLHLIRYGILPICQTFFCGSQRCNGAPARAPVLQIAHFVCVCAHPNRHHSAREHFEGARLPACDDDADNIDKRSKLIICILTMHACIAGTVCAHWAGGYKAVRHIRKTRNVHTQTHTHAHNRTHTDIVTGSISRTRSGQRSAHLSYPSSPHS